MSNVTEQAISDTQTVAATPDKRIVEAIQAFVDRVRTIPQVQKAVMEESRTPAYIWTVISAPPFEDTNRAPVYEAETAVLQQETYPLVGFHLINVQEIEQDLSNALPASHQILFERDYGERII